MEVYGADVHGVEGQLVRFEAVKTTNRTGVTMVGLPQRIVKEGLTRVAEAITTLEGPWGDVLSNQGYTVDMMPAETPKNSSGLDLPLAIMLLQASILQNLDALGEQIAHLESAAEKHSDGKAKNDRKRAILDQVKILVQQRDATLKYRRRLAENRNRYLLIGTLSIVDGKVRAPKYGLLSMICAAEQGMHIVVPEESETHAALLAEGKGVRAFKVANLQEAWDLLLGGVTPRPVEYHATAIRQRQTLQYVPDLKEIDGVALAKQAMRVAIAGGHNILLVGPAGQGKTMLAKAATGLLPDLTQKEMLEVNQVYSAAGKLAGNEVLLQRPYQIIQNTATEAAVFGSGRPLKPGLVSLAHTGILFFDEINLSNQDLIEQMRTVLSDGQIEVQRAEGSLRFPANVIFVAAMNPCKCGWHLHYQCHQCEFVSLESSASCPRHPSQPLTDKCKCTPAQIERYQRRISGPMLDRIDLKVLLTSHDTTAQGRKHSSSTVRKEIECARRIQEGRYSGEPSIHCNGDLEARSQLLKHGPVMDKAVVTHFRQIVRRLDISPRLQDKLLFVSRTIADLDSVTRVRQKDLDEATVIMGLGHPYFMAMH